MEIKNYFDRVVVINLKRRPDRLVSFKAALQDCNWPFKQPIVFEAVDGSIVPHPDGWQSGGGAWGCMRSHQRIFEEAMLDGVGNLLVMEDDACFAPDFAIKVSEFLAMVPEDWDQLMLGGQHFNTNGIPRAVKSGVYRCTDCERTHCYAIRGEFLKRLYRRWVRGGEFNGEAHCDWIMGRDPEMQAKHKVYAPERFLVGQSRSKSDINGCIQPRKFWNPPAPDFPIVVLQTTQEVAAKLRQHGLHTGFRRDTTTDMDTKLMEIFAETQDDPDDRAQRLGKWIVDIQWEVASDPYLICTVWHPEATREIVAEATPGPIYEVAGDSVEKVLLQLPEHLRRPSRPQLARMCVIHLDAPRRIVDELRVSGWHNGFWRDEASGLDKGLIKLCRDYSDRSGRETALSKVIQTLQDDAEGIHQGVAVIWHPEIDAEMVQAATCAKVIRIMATNIRDATEQWEDAKAAILETAEAKLMPELGPADVTLR